VFFGVKIPLKRPPMIADEWVADIIITYRSPRFTEAPVLEPSCDLLIVSDYVEEGKAQLKSLYSEKNLSFANKLLLKFCRWTYWRKVFFGISTIFVWLM